MIRIRPAGRKDAAALAEVAARSYRFGFAGILDAPQLEQRGPSYFRTRFRAEWREVHLAETDKGEVVGFIQIRDRLLRMIFVRPDHAGRGVAVLLLRRAEELGADRLECFRDNVRARRFYEREGWAHDRSFEEDFAGRTMAFVGYSRKA